MFPRIRPLPPHQLPNLSHSALPVRQIHREGLGNRTVDSLGANPSYGARMNDRFAHPGWIAVGAMGLIIIGYVATCLYVRAMRQSSFNSVKIGDQAETVIAQFGIPSVRET